jgi:hypothetical protein
MFIKKYLWYNGYMPKITRHKGGKMAKIFVRERVKVGEGDKEPRYAVVGVEGTDMKFFKTHMRKGEIETIAKEVKAEIVWLSHGEGEHKGKLSGGKTKSHRKHIMSKDD